MGASWVFTLRDVSGELSTVRVPLSANIGDTNYPDYAEFDTAATPANDALEALKELTACEVIKATFIAVENTYNNPLPANYVSAHRELKMAFSVRDTVTGKKGTLTVAGPDLVIIGLPTAGTDYYALITPIIDAWRDVLEDHMALEGAGNPIEVLSAHTVGRNT